MSYENGLKIFRPSLRETLDKQPLGREPDMSLCRRHTMSMIKLYWSQSMDPWTERQDTRMLPPISIEPWAAIKKALH